MPESGKRVQPFAYEAQTPQGEAFNGTIDAEDVDAATRALSSLQLRVMSMKPLGAPVAAGAALRGADFLAFNQQLSQLTAGGLPVERSLRLLAKEMRGRRAAAINAVAEELEKGMPLDAAFATHATLFPPLYGLLIRAGVKTSNLPAMLLNLGRHVEMIQRLRAAFWRAATYPLTVLAALLVVMAFLWMYVIPQFLAMLDTSSLTHEFHLSGVNDWDWVIPVATYTSFAVMILVGLILLATVFFAIAGRFRGGGALAEKMLLPMPLVGPILRLNLLARWCDALYLSANAGLDLPAALTLAGKAVGSPPLAADSRKLAEAVSAGQRIEFADTRLLPAVVPTALQLAADHHDLPATAAMLGKMYQEQAEIRLSLLPQVLSPIFMVLIAICITLALSALLVPLMAFINLLGGMTSHF